MLNKLLFLFSLCTKSILVTEIEPLMSYGLFYQCPYYVSGPGNVSVVLLSMEGQRALRFHKKYFNDIIFSLRCTSPLILFQDVTVLSVSYILVSL